MAAFFNVFEVPQMENGWKKEDGKWSMAGVQRSSAEQFRKTDHGLILKQSAHPAIPSRRFRASDPFVSSSFALMLGSPGLHLHNGVSSNATVRASLRLHLLRSPRRS